MRLFNPIMAAAPEGWLIMVALAVFAGLCGAQDWVVVAWTLLLLELPLAVFFIDRSRAIPSKPRGVLAPVDGHVIYRRECHDPVLDREAVRVGIRISFWGAYSLRSPVEGEIQALPVGVPGESASLLRTDEGEEFLLRVRGHGLIGMPPIWAPVGERVGQGRRCGLRRLAREIDVFLPATARVEVQIGARVRCGQTLIATILRKT